MGVPGLGLALGGTRRRTAALAPRRAPPTSPEFRARKLAALACFRSQIEPLGDAPEDAAILPPAELAHFRRDFEVIWR